jgi:hypothetical protein
MEKLIVDKNIDYWSKILIVHNLFIINKNNFDWNQSNWLLITLLLINCWIINSEKVNYLSIMNYNWLKKLNTAILNKKLLNFNNFDILLNKIRNNIIFYLFSIID